MPPKAVTAAARAKLFVWLSLWLAAGVAHRRSVQQAAVARALPVARLGAEDAHQGALPAPDAAAAAATVAGVAAAAGADSRATCRVQPALLLEGIC